MNAYNAALTMAAAEKLGPCIVCGAKRGEPCVSLSSHGDCHRGEVRPRPHFYR